MEVTSVGIPFCEVDTIEGTGVNLFRVNIDANIEISNGLFLPSDIYDADATAGIDGAYAFDLLRPVIRGFCFSNINRNL